MFPVVIGVILEWSLEMYYFHAHLRQQQRESCLSQPETVTGEHKEILLCVSISTSYSWLVHFTGAEVVVTTSCSFSKHLITCMLPLIKISRSKTQQDSRQGIKVLLINYDEHWYDKHFVSWTCACAGQGQLLVKLLVVSSWDHIYESDSKYISLKSSARTIKGLWRTLLT